MSENTISFLLGNELQQIEVQDTNTTVLQYLRTQAGRCGSKEGCAEGDCGACTVVVGRLSEGHIKYQAVNACIQFLVTLDGCQLLTIEDLRLADGSLHPVQQSLVQHHASQCGFCTPGFAMSLFALYEQGARHNKASSEQFIQDTLAGNLCRCTGYGPILDAARDIASVDPQQRIKSENKDLIETLSRICGNERNDVLSIEFNSKRFFAPRSLHQLSQLVLSYPQAVLLAGGTDIGLWVTKQLQQLDTIIYLGKVEALKKISFGQDVLNLGAMVTYSEALPSIAKYIPQMAELVTRIGSTQIRNNGTIGGNIANGSPIGDMPPPLIALGASLQLRKGDTERLILLENFFVEYGKQDLQESEFIKEVYIPAPKPTDLFAVYKISKRFDQDISAICAAFFVRLDAAEKHVEQVRICFGGMAGIPARAHQAEAIMRGSPWNEKNIEDSMSALAQDYTPLSDQRASEDYRRLVSQNLLKRFYLESQTRDQQSVRIARNVGGVYE